MISLRIKYENVSWGIYAIVYPRYSDNDQCSLRFVVAHLRSQVSDLLLMTVFWGQARAAESPVSRWAAAGGVGSSFTTDGCSAADGTLNWTGGGEAAAFLALGLEEATSIEAVVLWGLAGITSWCSWELGLVKGYQHLLARLSYMRQVASCTQDHLSQGTVLYTWSRGSGGRYLAHSHASCNLMEKAGQADDPTLQMGQPK